MGFGWLFIGYFVSTLMVINLIGDLIRPIGYAIMLYAFSKLKDYRYDFLYPLAVTFLMLLLALVLAVESVFPFFPEKATYTLGYIEMIGSFLFQGTLCWAIRAIAKETGMDKISFAATRNFIFFAVYNLLYAIAHLPFACAGEYAKLMSVPVLLLYFACLILNLILIFSCYAKICDVSDEDMPRKPSRFAFVNQMRAEAEARREEKEKIYAERIRERKERKERGKK